MPTQPLVVLAAGRAQQPLLRRATDLGFDTWAFDRDPAAPGRDDATRFAAVSAHDADAVLSRLRPWASEEAPVGVVALSSAPAALVCGALVASSFGLAGPSLDSLKRVLDRGAQRSALELAGVPLPPGGIYLGIPEAAKAARRLGGTGRAVLKPASGTSGSRGVFFIDADNDAELWAARASALGDGRVVVEEALRGTEYSVDGVVQADGVVVLAVTRKEMRRERPIPTGYRTLVEDSAPRSALVELAEVTVKAVGISDTAFNLDVMWNEAGPVVIEIGMLLDAKIDRLLDYAGFDVYGALCAAATRTPVEAFPEFSRGTALRFLYARAPLRLDAERMRAAEALVQKGGGRLEWQCAAGAEALAPQALSDTLGWVTCTGLDGDAAWERALRLDDAVLALLS